MSVYASWGYMHGFGMPAQNRKEGELGITEITWMCHLAFQELQVYTSIFWNTHFPKQEKNVVILT